MPFYDFWRKKRVTRLGKRLSYLSARHTLDCVSPFVTSLTHVIEIGPGRGAFANVCFVQKINYLAVDVNRGLLQQLTSFDGICAFVPPLPVQDAVYDAAIANHVLEHASDLPQAQSFLAEMIRVVRSGGCIALTSPDYLWNKEYFWDCDYSHNFPVTSRRLYQMFQDHGLEVVYLGYTHNHLTGWKGNLLGRLFQLLPYRMPNAQPIHDTYIEQLYKIRQTFSRSVVIVGRKV